MITTAKFVSLNIADYDRALAFYRDILGFEVLVDAPYGEEMGGQPGDRWIQVSPKGAQTSIHLQRDADAAGGWAPIVFDSDDIVATCDELKAKGVEVTMEPAEASWGWWAQFKDPDGNEFGLGQSES